MLRGLPEINYDNFMGFDCQCNFLTDIQFNLDFDLLTADDLYIYIYIYNEDSKQNDKIGPITKVIIDEDIYKIKTDFKKFRFYYAYETFKRNVVLNDGNPLNAPCYLLLPDEKTCANIEKLLIQYARLIKNFLPDNIHIDPDRILIKQFQDIFSSKMYFIKDNGELVLKLILSAEKLAPGDSICNIYNNKNITFMDFTGNELTLTSTEDDSGIIKYSGLQIEDLINYKNYNTNELLNNFKLEILFVYHIAEEYLRDDKTFNLSFETESGFQYSKMNAKSQNFLCLFELYSDKISSNHHFYLDFNLLLYEQLQFHFGQVNERINTKEFEKQYKYLDKDTILLNIFYRKNFIFNMIRPNHLRLTEFIGEPIPPYFHPMFPRYKSEGVFILSKIKYDLEGYVFSISIDDFIDNNGSGILQFNIIINDISKSSCGLIGGYDTEIYYGANLNKQNPSKIMLYFDSVLDPRVKFKISYEDLIKMILKWFTKLGSMSTNISKNSIHTKNINMRKLKAICTKLNIRQSSNINKTLNMILQKINEN